MEGVTFFYKKGGADINGVNPHHFTALMAASLAGHSDIVKLLLTWGADVRLKHPTGLTVIECALASKDRKTIEVLKDNGCMFWQPVMPMLSRIEILLEEIRKDFENKEKLLVNYCLQACRVLREKLCAVEKAIDNDAENPYPSQAEIVQF
jgi:ankyrin repeat protein